MGAPGWVRQAGRAPLAGGRLVLWSVAEGLRGRRWRASTRDPDGRLVDDLLLEVEPTGRLARLELATAAGQLTFHADPDELEAHGNIVTPHGMRHLALAWAPGRAVEVPWSPVVDAVLAARVPGGGAVAVGSIAPDLVPRTRTVAIERVGEWAWRVEGRAVSLDARGLPLLPGGEHWPLEA